MKEDKSKPNEEMKYKFYGTAPLVSDHTSVNLYDSLGIINFRSMLPELFGECKNQSVQFDTNPMEIQPHTRIAMDREALKTLRDQLVYLLGNGG
jgi:hypothetical protein